MSRLIIANSFKKTKSFIKINKKIIMANIIIIFILLSNYSRVVRLIIYLLSLLCNIITLFDYD